MPLALACLLLAPALAAARQPAGFVEAAPEVFVAQEREAALVVDPQGLALRHGDLEFRLRFENGRARSIDGLDPLAGDVHLLVGGDSRRWRTGLQRSRRLRLHEIWPGVDAVVRAEGGGFRYDFELAPGADFRSIRLALEPPARARLTPDGGLVLEADAERLRESRPVCFQTAPEGRLPVRCGFALNGRTVTFNMAATDPSLPLVIDPPIVFATYLGGARSDAAFAAATDTAGNIYLTGQTVSRAFPTTPAALRETVPDEENSFAFVTKISPDGRLVYSTYLGGSVYDVGDAIAVDAAGAAYIAGETNSPDFPVTSGAFQRRPGGGLDAFVAKLSPDGSRLEYATYLAGASSDVGRGIAVDAGGRAFVTGSTSSTDFPTTDGAYQREPGGSDDVFVAQLDPLGRRLEYSTRIGGVGGDHATDIAVGAGGEAVVAGWTDTRRTLGLSDAFCLKLDRRGSELLYLKFIGGFGQEFAEGVAIDAAGAAYVAGGTNSNDFPATAGAALRERLPGSLLRFDGFVVKLDPTGETYEYSTYLPDGAARTIAIDPSGRAFAAGSSEAVTLPHFPEPAPATETGDAFVIEISPDGSRFDGRARFGGSGLDDAFAVAAAETEGEFYVVGMTSSGNLPVPAEAVQVAFGGGLDVFLTRFRLAEAPAIGRGGVVDAAAYRPTPVTPGGIFTIFGERLGPPEPLLGAPGPDGEWPRSLGGVQVLVDSRPAPVLFVSEHQLSAVAPLGLPNGPWVDVEVVRDGLGSGFERLPIAAAAPRIFTRDASGRGLAATLNEDGSVNGPGNPAPAGSVIQIFAVGGGDFSPRPVEGKAAIEAGRTLVDVTAQLDGRPAAVRYAGPAPGLVAGVLQVNLLLPQALAASGEVELTLEANGERSQSGVVVAIH